MDITKNTPAYSFKGYDARPLRGFLMSSNCYGIADEMKKIGEKEGFKIYSPTINSTYDKCIEGTPPHSKIFLWAWAQDYWTIVKNTLISREMDSITLSIKNFFKLKSEPIQKNLRKKAQNIDEDFLDKYLKETHIPGGNIFIIKDGKHQDVLIGEDELLKFSPEQIQRMYKAHKVIPLPQMDFHLDMFIRPLDNKRVLLTDDTKTLEVINEILSKIPDNHKKAKNNINFFKSKIEENIASNILPQSKQIEKILQENGYEVIKVPGRIYTQKHNKPEELHYICNYMNANALINNEGKLVYITNKSNIDKLMGLSPKIKKEIGEGFEEAFIKSLSPYVDRKHIYFIDGKNNFVSTEMLSQYSGGIHCATSEVPFPPGEITT